MNTTSSSSSVLLSHVDFLSLLRGKMGTLIVGLETITSPTIKKGGPSEVLKISKGRIVIGASYQSAVRVQGGEGFESSSLPWGEWLISKKVVTHKGEYYLAQVRRNSPPLKSFFTSQGEAIAKADVTPFLRKAYENKRQAEAGVEGKKQVDFKLIKFSSIKTIKYGGRTFELVA
jgi:hypothetical protein